MDGERRMAVEGEGVKQQVKMKLSILLKDLHVVDASWMPAALIREKGTGLALSKKESIVELGQYLIKRHGNWRMVMVGSRIIQADLSAKKRFIEEFDSTFNYNYF